MTNEAFARIKIDQLLKDTDWRLTDGISVRYEYPLDDGGRADWTTGQASPRFTRRSNPANTPRRKSSKDPAGGYGHARLDSRI